MIGSSEDLYDNVDIQMYDLDQKPQEPGKVAFFSSGRLGGFHGGLLRLKDARKPLQAQELVTVQDQVVAAQIQQSRHGCHSPMA